MGKLKEARPLCEEALQGTRETLGDRHQVTLGSINNMSTLLIKMFLLEEARPLLKESLQACRATLGDRHPHTLTSMHNMGMLLSYMYGARLNGHGGEAAAELPAELQEARLLLEEVLQARRETLGDRHPDTQSSVLRLAGLQKLKAETED